MIQTEQQHPAQIVGNGTMYLKDETERADAPWDDADLNTIHGNVEESLKRAMTIDGAIGVALMDHENYISLGQAGGGERLNIDYASAGNTTVVRANMQVMKDLGLDDKIEDILISLGRQYHVIRPLREEPNWFLYLALERDKANLAMARHKLTAIEKNLVV